MRGMIKKLESNTLNDVEKQILVEILKEQNKTIEYYSQSFIGVWDCQKVNVNWRAKKCNEHIEAKTKEIQEKNSVVIDTENKDV